MKEIDLEENNKLIAEFMGWYVDIEPYDENYPTQEWSTLRNKNGDWSSSKCVHTNNPDADKEREQNHKKMWEHLVNPCYGKCSYKDWNSLMPVVEKIESLKYTVRIGAEPWVDDETGNVIRNKTQHVCLITNWYYQVIINSAGSGHNKLSKLDSTYFAVVNFIKWYNENN